MTDIEYRNTLYEIDEILKLVDNSLIDMIPEKVIKNIKLNKSRDHNFSINSIDEFDETKILKSTQVYLAALYINYWCSEVEKQEFIQEMNTNEQIYQDQLREKYNPNNLFINKCKSTLEDNNNQEQLNTQQMQIIEYKKANIFKMIFAKIKKFLRNKY